jgi:hypothetical protein
MPLWGRSTTIPQSAVMRTGVSCSAAPAAASTGARRGRSSSLLLPVSRFGLSSVTAQRPPQTGKHMRLYVCWSTNGSAHHDRHKAHQALVDAGYSPDIVKARGQEHLPKSLQFRFRREVHALTGSFFVPVLVLDDGSALNEPDEIVTWAKAHAAAYETASFDSRRGTGLNRWSQRCLLVVGRVVGPQHRLVSSIRGSCVGGR